jgi:type IV secretory pathway VirJ component
MKRRKKIFLGASLALLGGLALIWHPWSHVSLEDATIVIPAAAGVAPPPGKDDVLAIVYSGDGGWADLDRQLGDVFVTRGIPVLGVSMLPYFWRARSPDLAAAELDALITDHLASSGKHRVWLVGFSFGADVLPTLLDKLSPASRSRVTQLVLLSASRTANFEIELQGYMRESWFSTHLKTFLQWVNPVPHYDALPPLLALQGHPPVTCYYGVEDIDDTVCARNVLPAWITVHQMPGDHHFGGDYHALANRLIDELPASGPMTTVKP